MRIGIIIHSQTGNTLSVGEKIKAALNNEGHDVKLERVTAVDEKQTGTGQVVLQNIPDLAMYDMIIFGAPVHGFSLSPVMQAYIKQIPQLNCKSACCFVTQKFPKPWMGGNRAIKQTVSLCAEKGLNSTVTGIINWSSKSREHQITHLISKMK